MGIIVGRLVKFPKHQKMGAFGFGFMVLVLW